MRYDLEKRGQVPLYEYLYQCLKEDIQRGRLLAGTKLPSKREMARDNGVSVRTMNAYDQLLVEGYLVSREKSGYFVADVEAVSEGCRQVMVYPEVYEEEQWFADFTTNQVVYGQFPFATWRKVMREVLSRYDSQLVRRAHFLGIRELRQAIADYLYRSRSMTVSPECIVIGAGIEYLYSRLIRILPKDAVYGAENPGYRKIPRIFEESGFPWTYVDGREWSQHGQPQGERSLGTPCFAGTSLSSGHGDVRSKKTGTFGMGQGGAGQVHH